MSAELPKILFSDPFTSEIQSYSQYMCPGRKFYFPELGYGSVYTDTHNTLSDKMIDVGASFETTEDGHIFWRMNGIVPVVGVARQDQAMADIDLLTDSVRKAAANIEPYLAYRQKLRQTDDND